MLSMLLVGLHLIIILRDLNLKVNIIFQFQVLALIKKLNKNIKLNRKKSNLHCDLNKINYLEE